MAKHTLSGKHLRPDSQSELTTKKVRTTYLRENPYSRNEIVVTFAQVTTKSYDSSEAVLRTFYDQINMADSIAQLLRDDQRTFIFLHALLARPDFKQQEKRKKSLKPTTTNVNAGSTDTREKQQRQRSHRPSELDRIGLAGTPTAPTVLGQDRLPTTGWLAEWNMPARPLWTLTV
ncbi:hypothetical protein ANAPRD1_01366 [Anaplasma phagocytophilum]|nr:hypothetical protein ANAPRD1_01366 [Anaplasma phagocytophilum]